MTTLVTGAAGFLGQYVVEQLVARGDRVRALVRRPCPALESLGVEIATADVRDAAAVARACAGAQVVHHVAGVAGIWGPWDRYYSINTVGTRNVIAGCRAAGVGRLVYTSSPSVTFDGRRKRGSMKADPMRPVGFVTIRIPKPWPKPKCSPPMGPSWPLARCGPI